MITLLSDAHGGSVSLQGRTQKTPYWQPSSSLTPMRQALSIRTSKTDSVIQHVSGVISFLFIFSFIIVSGPDSSGYWWTRLINSQQRRFVFSVFLLKSFLNTTSFHIFDPLSSPALLPPADLSGGSGPRSRSHRPRWQHRLQVSLLHNHTRRWEGGSLTGIVGSS